MSYGSNFNPITVLNMFYNILCKAGTYGTAFRVAKITGTVVGVPQEALDVKGFRNLLNKALTLSPDDNRAVLLVYENPGTVTNAFSHPSHDNIQKILNSVFVLVQDDLGGKPRVAVNLSVFNAPDADGIPTATPTPTSV